MRGFWLPASNHMINIGLGGSSRLCWLHIFVQEMRLDCITCQLCGDGVSSNMMWKKTFFGVLSMTAMSIHFFTQRFHFFSNLIFALVSHTEWTTGFKSCSHTSACRVQICCNVPVALYYKCIYSQKSMCKDTSTHLHKNTHTQSV